MKIVIEVDEELSTASIIDYIECIKIDDKLIKSIEFNKN